MIAASLPLVVNTLLGLALATGAALAAYSFGQGRHPPPWLAKLHGLAAVAAVALLLFSWTHTAPTRIAAFGAACLVLAVALGLVLNLAYHWRQRPLPESLVFVHLSVAFLGTLLVALTLLGREATP